MNVLLDTHTFLWFVLDDQALSRDARHLLEEPGNDLLLSSASVWEMAIKASLGKLRFQQPLDVFIPQQLRLNSILLLDIALPHLFAVATLQFHHRDPFDRLLIAQSMVEQLPIISADTIFDAYAVQRLW